MIRLAAVVTAVLLAATPGLPALAATAQQKAATCKFGADSQKLAGAARAKFMKNCMANRDDPRGGGASGPATVPAGNN